MKFKSAMGLLVLFLALSLTLICVNAQAKPTLSVSFYKNNGYGSGSDMNGEWTIKTEGSQNVAYAEFYLDNQLQLNATAAPFSWNFNTGSYSEGQHTIKVVAYDSAGETATQEIQRNFVGFPLTFVVGIIVLVIVVVTLSFGFVFYRARKTEKEYQKKKQN
jgi:hypothetical protein